MPGLVPGIHVIRAARLGVNGRDKPGHDERCGGTAPNPGPHSFASSDTMSPSFCQRWPSNCTIWNCLLTR
ncbi:hypothetical protein DCM75_20645 [Bradyrhizobium sp. WBOS02]|uniref:Uncharacterized protein n=1 Tax=Bradyrhizobium betae TaxID=244734 RepID=A0AAE9SRB7_9BRAD|nr:hypothetical protein [Bradyrhizobium sp. WBOS2]MDD1570261.1 hypothetical protein [Bradyrhizobium sp. WBOS1]MDD1599192.1 hypothetical protein [Bradyrhizobium sp. WBOS16]UUO36600.1 hypothetical protein DCK84_19890 [Bradyrhizobium sp. WBOS01]UUO42903.1 hypothetical protein DCM75_20645 [Bradyrhizobium sp. WBOS02]UUO54141.1 hypothetical protein DCM79_14860 [Bradyrhizobium sp. WBOS07]UUO68145.1 hypothetical protein DCM83_24970 [Bradyrhizobium betae]